MDFRTDVVIVGTGVAGTFSALNLPKDKNIIMITKSDLESSDSFLAQGGICVLTDENDYDNYFEDTMKAGHYENRKESVDIMIRSSFSRGYHRTGDYEQTSCTGEKASECNDL